MTNKEFATEFISYAKKNIEEISEVDPNETNAKIKIAKAHETNSALQQANNTFRSALQHDVAKAKMSNYKSSFLD